MTTASISIPTTASSVPTLAARIDPPHGVSAAVRGLEAQCDAWAPLTFPPGEMPRLTREAQLCDQVTGRGVYPTDAVLAGMMTGIFAGLFLAIILRALRIWIGNIIAMLSRRLQPAMRLTQPTER